MIAGGMATDAPLTQWDQGTSMKGAIDREHWSQFAREWIEWARTPNHDAFWAYRDQLLSFIGQGEGEAVDIGCGEGRVSRLLKECGYRVAAVDPVEDFVAAAAEADSANAYAIAAAAALPFEDARFDVAVLYNVLMDVEDVPAALKEARRVLRPSGALFIAIVHPVTDCGRFIDTGPDAPYVRLEPISAAAASRASKSAMACGCTSPDGRSRWKTMLPPWRTRVWRSRPYGSLFQMLAVEGNIWSFGAAFRCSSG
jgi:SAM-dependent methyltransferase